MQVVDIICIAYILFISVFGFKCMINNFYQFTNKHREPQIYQLDISFVGFFVNFFYLVFHILVWHIQDFSHPENCLSYILNSLSKYVILE